MDFFNTSFYDKESAGYSDRRYGRKPATYVQFFFQRRLWHVMNLVGKYTAGKSGLILVEDGCADGVVLNSILRKFPKVFSRGIGFDISPKMIETARAISLNVQKETPADFYVKNEMSQNTHEHACADIFLGVGFISPGIFSDEFSFVEKHLKDDGIFILSLVARDSLFARFKLRDKEIRSDYLSFSQYEKILAERFIVLESIPYGLFIPKLWAFHPLARCLQPVFENVFRIFPSLFHETLYVVKKKR